MSTITHLDPTSDVLVAERVVTAQEIAAYREVVRGRTAMLGRDRECDQAPARSEESSCLPTASPIHPFVLIWDLFQEAVRALSPGGAEGAAPVHLSQEITQHRPLRPDENVTVEVSVLGARRDPRGVRLALKSVLTGADDETFAELVTGVLLLGATGPEPFGELPSHPNPGGGAWSTIVTRNVPRDLPGRYAEVSGDNNPIHLDREAALAAGFPDVIAHGMSVMAMVCEEVVSRFGEGDASVVRSVGGRFSVPVVPGEPLDICLLPDGDGRFVRYSCKTPRGIAVKNGWVEMALERRGGSSGG